MHRYVMSYVERFDLAKHIFFKTKVQAAEQNAGTLEQARCARAASSSSVGDCDVFSVLLASSKNISSLLKQTLLDGSPLTMVILA